MLTYRQLVPVGSSQAPSNGSGYYLRPPDAPSRCELSIHGLPAATPSLFVLTCSFSLSLSLPPCLPSSLPLSLSLFSVSSSLPPWLCFCLSASNPPPGPHSPPFPKINPLRPDLMHDIISQGTPWHGPSKYSLATLHFKTPLSKRS